MNQGMMVAGPPYAPPMNSMQGMMNQAGPYPMPVNMSNNSAGKQCIACFASCTLVFFANSSNCESLN